MKIPTNATDNAEINAAANSWWVRLDSDTVSGRERKQFADWYDADLQHRKAFDAVCTLWDELDAVKLRFDSAQRATPIHQSATKHPLAELGMSKVGGSRRRSLSGIESLFHRLWAAPALVMCCLALWLFSPLPILLRADFYTGYGERRDLALNDGSVVHLNSNSALAVHIDSKQRQLTLLKGEAWFEVSPDKSRPFQVHAEHGTVTALGTAFNIRLRNSLAEVSVTQHSVAIDVEQAEGQALHTVVKEGQQLVYDQLAGLGNIKAIDAQTVTAWQRGKLVFENQPLGEVMAELNRYHLGYLVISDNSIAQRRVNGVFNADQPLIVLGALESSLQLHSTRINDYLILLHR